jgi:hypothetical protein
MLTRNLWAELFGLVKPFQPVYARPYLLLKLYCTREPNK